MPQLTDKVAIITGGARGMGAATTRLFVAAGAKVVISDLLEKEGAALARELGDTAVFHRHDVTDEAGWQMVVADAMKRWGRIDALVNNAGILHYQTIPAFAKADFERVLSVNLTGTLLGMKHVAPHMIARKSGAIVNISSTAGLEGVNGAAAYCASKWGVRGLTKVAALEFGRHNVRVNSVHPGGVNTIMGNPNDAPVDLVNRNFTAAPLNRIAAPEEIGRVSLFLCSDDASYMNGAELAVDGGMTAGHYFEMLPGFNGA